MELDSWLVFWDAFQFSCSTEVKEIKPSWSKLSTFVINEEDMCQLKVHFIAQFSVSRVARCIAGLELSMSTFCLLHIHPVPQGEKNFAKGTSLFIFTIFLESFGERGKTGMFMKVSRWSGLHPQLFFSVLGPWRINQSQWQGLIAKHCGSFEPRGNLSSTSLNSDSAPGLQCQGKSKPEVKKPCKVNKTLAA